MTPRDTQAAGLTVPPGNHGAPSPTGTSASPVYRPTLDVFDLGDRYEVRVDLPGATPDRIQASVEESVLSIHAQVEGRQPAGAAPCLEEYGIGDFGRRIRLGEDVDTRRLSATYELGVLTITLPKTSEHQPRRVPVVAG